MNQVCSFEALGLAPVPWSVPNIGNATTRDGRRFRFATRSKKSNLALGKASLADWQKFVANAAREAMGGREPTTSMVVLHCEFLSRTPKGCRDGDPWAVEVIRKVNKKGEQFWAKKSKRGQVPDLTNLVKGVEDALEGVAYVNDVLVRSTSAGAMFGPREGVRVFVKELNMGSWEYRAKLS